MGDGLCSVNQKICSPLVCRLQQSREQAALCQVHLNMADRNQLCAGSNCFIKCLDVAKIPSEPGRIIRSQRPFDAVEAREAGWSGAYNCCNYPVPRLPVQSGCNHIDSFCRIPGENRCTLFPPMKLLIESCASWIPLCCNSCKPVHPSTYISAILPVVFVH